MHIHCSTRAERDRVPRCAKRSTLKEHNGAGSPRMRHGSPHLLPRRTGNEREHNHDDRVFPVREHAAFYNLSRLSLFPNHSIHGALGSIGFLRAVEFS